MSNWKPVIKLYQVRSRIYQTCFHQVANDTKLNGVIDMLEGRAVIQRDLERLEEWAHVKLRKFNKTRFYIWIRAAPSINKDWGMN